MKELLIGIMTFLSTLLGVQARADVVVPTPTPVVEVSPAEQGYHYCGKEGTGYWTLEPCSYTLKPITITAPSPLPLEETPLVESTPIPYPTAGTFIPDMGGLDDGGWSDYLKSREEASKRASELEAKFQEIDSRTYVPSYSPSPVIIEPMPSIGNSVPVINPTCVEHDGTTICR